MTGVPLASLVELTLLILEFGGFVHLRGLPLGGGPIRSCERTEILRGIVSPCLSVT
jgi:hypothetical protein